MKQRYFDLAKQVSLLSTHHQHRIGSCLVIKNKPVSFGYNKAQTHCKSTHPYQSQHSELTAIVNARGVDLSRATIYLYRERKDGSLGNAKPCKYCQELLRAFGVKSVCYTTENGCVEERVTDLK